jgi:hypothetical protein
MIHPKAVPCLDYAIHIPAGSRVGRVGLLGRNSSANGAAFTHHYDAGL